MPDPTARLIRIVDGTPRVADDDWTVVDAGASGFDGPLEPRRILPLKIALARREQLAAARPVGIWLAPDEDPVDAAALFEAVDLIAVQFPSFTDGRGYSTATLLRTRHGWRGELRAIGDVLQDTLFYLRRVGFDSFALRAGRDPHKALKAFSTFSDSYQGAVLPGLPHFRRPKDSAIAPKIESALALLRQAASLKPAVFSTSFGAEDMVLLHLIRTHGLPIGIFTLDTGRLPPETHALMQKVEETYGRCFETYFPDAAGLQQLVTGDGANGFYQSIEARKRCCGVRKVEPLSRALAGRAAWVTGLRSAQSAERAALAPRQTDTAYRLEKFNPLHDWTEAEVWEYIRTNNVPYNELHDRFYPSIGCAPCTRAISVGEDPRAGRWWWENGQTRECGLHARTVSTLPIRLKEIA
jgi:phosphoadenosine phosphosulfate reductase